MNYGIYSRAVDQGAVLLQRGSQRFPGGGNSWGWHTQGGRSAASAALGTLGTLWFVPLVLAEPSVLDVLGFEVTTLSAGTAHIGLYDSEPIGSPASLQGYYGSVDTGTTGFKNVQVGQLLPAGVWWAGIVQVSGTPSWRFYEGAPIDSLQIGAWGQSSAAGPAAAYQTTTQPGELLSYVPASRLGSSVNGPRASWRITS